MDNFILSEYKKVLTLFIGFVTFLDWYIQESWGMVGTIE